MAGRRSASALRVVLCGLIVGASASRAIGAERRYTQIFDIAVGAGSSEGTGAFSWSHFYGFGDDRRVLVGLGARFSTFFGGHEVDYRTADATLIKEGKLNILEVSRPRTHALNVELAIKYRPSRRLEAGFDIDLLGFGFGKSVDARYHATEPAFLGVQQADPSSLSLLKGGNPDRGQLDSEFFLAYWWSERWGLRLGFSHFLSEYTAARRLDFGNDRFRHNGNLAFIGLSYRR